MKDQDLKEKIEDVLNFVNETDGYSRFRQVLMDSSEINTIQDWKQRFANFNFIPDFELLNKISRKGEKVALLLSGGLDSTLLLLLLTVGFKIDVDAYFIAPGFSYDEKIKAEKEAIEDIIDEIRKSPVEKGDIRLTEISRRDHELNGALGIKLVQPTFWATSLLEVMNTRHVGAIAFGYILGDDMIMHLDNLRTLINTQLKIMYGPMPLDIEIIFPLMLLSKRRIIELLPKALLKHVHWCEHPHEARYKLMDENAIFDNYSDLHLCKHTCVPCSKLAAVIGLKAKVMEGMIREVMEGNQTLRSKDAMMWNFPLTIRQSRMGTETMETKDI